MNAISKTRLPTTMTLRPVKEKWSFRKSLRLGRSAFPVGTPRTIIAKPVR